VGGSWDGEGDDRPLHLEVATGLTGGDVARSYDLRLAFAGHVGTLVGRYQHDAFTPGLGWALGLGVYGAPWPWLRAGGRLGLLTGRKFLSTGYERWYGGGLQAADVQEYSPSPALRGSLEPRVEVWPVRLGPIRPGMTALLALRYYDAFVVEDLVDVDYPDRPGGWQVEPGVALGASRDLGGGRAVRAEVGHSWRVGAARAHHVQAGLLGAAPAIPEDAGGSTFVTVSFTQGFLR
jgi:hypothetical protein